MTKNKNNKKDYYILVVPTIITAIVGIISSFLTYNLGISNIQIPLNATRTAEARAPVVISSTAPLPTTILGQEPISNTLLETMLLRGDVPFVWQWAGENWYGRVILSEIDGRRVVSQANMGLIQKTTQDAILIEGKVFSLAPGTLGTFEINNDGSITLDFAIQKKSRRTSTIDIETIHGTLKPSLCYAGSFSYAGIEGSYSGDVILVNDTSSLGASVDEWFEENQDWFESYLIDR